MFGLLITRSGVLHGHHLVVSDQPLPQECEVECILVKVSNPGAFSAGMEVVIEPGLIGDLVGDELGVVSRGDALVDKLELLRLDRDVSLNELSHLHIVGKDVDWEIFALSDGDEFHLVSVRLGIEVDERHVGD